jgi:hypothetical protein
MTHRERLVGTLKFQPVDRVPDYEFGTWSQTLARWHQEGLPEKHTDWRVMEEYFGTDDELRGSKLGLETGLFPKFKHQVLEEKGDHRIVVSDDGAIYEEMKPEIGVSIPICLRHAIESRADWETLRDERLNPATPGRYPADLEALCSMTWGSEDPVLLFCGSLYGYIRNWMGVEALSYALYDEPEWVGEMMEHMTFLILSILGKIGGRAKVDVGTWWEDMCFSTGPLMSPRHFQELLMPRYKKVMSFLRNECQCDLGWVDCDGNIRELAGLWLESGINVMWPLEAAHTDAYELSCKYGTRMALRGYFSKLALIEGKDAIDREFDRLRPLFRKGGFIPHTDHLVPPDVSFENYCYYRMKKCEFIGKE